jgi:hypothetical protein
LDGYVAQLDPDHQEAMEAAVDDDSFLELARHFGWR